MSSIRVKQPSSPNFDRKKNRIQSYWETPVHHYLMIISYILLNSDCWRVNHNNLPLDVSKQRSTPDERSGSQRGRILRRWDGKKEKVGAFLSPTKSEPIVDAVNLAQSVQGDPGNWEIEILPVTHRKDDKCYLSVQNALS